jgi:hypothetical protein
MAEDRAAVLSGAPMCLTMDAVEVSREVLTIAALRDEVSHRVRRA